MPAFAEHLINKQLNHGLRDAFALFFALQFIGKIQNKMSAKRWVINLLPEIHNSLRQRCSRISLAIVARGFVCPFFYSFFVLSIRQWIPYSTTSTTTEMIQASLCGAGDYAVASCSTHVEAKNLLRHCPAEIKWKVNEQTDNNIIPDSGLPTAFWF